jgi:uncharacterized lipoprotein
MNRGRRRAPPDLFPQETPSMIPMHRSLRPLLVAAVAFALATGASGCHWFKTKSDYAKSREDRPLEVPPDLDVPDTSGSTALPASVTASGAGLAAPSALRTADVLVPGATATQLFPKIGAALEGIEGVTINGRAEALSSYDVTYKGLNFLVRAQDSQAGGSRLIALSADGRMLSTGPGAELLKLVRAKL